jgi:hypothetical protein
MAVEKIWVLSETAAGRPLAVVLELLSEARRLVGAAGVVVAVTYRRRTDPAVLSTIAPEGIIE